MANNINVVVLSGNLTHDPQIRATQSGTAIMSFSIAVNESVKNGSTGEWEQYTNFFDMCMFGKRAEALSKMLTKGMRVTVTGRLKYSSWERDGQKRSKVEVIADNVELPQRQRQQDAQGDGGYQPQGNYAQQQQIAPQNAYQGQQQPQYPQQGYQPEGYVPQQMYSEGIPF